MSIKEISQKTFNEIQFKFLKEIAKYEELFKGRDSIKVDDAFKRVFLQSMCFNDYDLSYGLYEELKESLRLKDIS